MSKLSFTPWVHCNNCYLIYDKKKLFCLVACKHVFCRDCLEQKVTRNENKCPFCKRQVRHKMIDHKLEPHLKAALDADSYTPLENAINNLEMNIRQTSHLHSGIQRSRNQYLDYEKMHKQLDEDQGRLDSALGKVRDQNEKLKMEIQEQEKKNRLVKIRKSVPQPVQEKTVHRPEKRIGNYVTRPTNDILRKRESHIPKAQYKYSSGNYKNFLK